MSQLTRSFPAQLSNLRRALARVEEPADALKVGAGIAGIEEAMRKSGLYRIDQIRPVRELFLDSRWVLGRLLTKIMRHQGARSTSSRAGTKLSELKKLGLDKNRASEAERIGTLPEVEKNKAYRDAARDEILPTIDLLIDVARPYWYQASRAQKHKDIATSAKLASIDDLGPFPLLYADPPWKFATYSEKGLERTPDQHYPTLTYDEIAHFKIGDRLIRDIAAKDAALLLWCTSSNVDQALGIMQAWGFAFKSSAVWIKTKTDGSIWTGLGLVFRNAHELVLYGTRGERCADTAHTFAD